MEKVKHTTLEGRVLEVTVREATVGDGLRRARLMQEAVQSDEGVPKEYQSVVADLLRLNTFPACAACSSDFRDSENPDVELPGFTFMDFAGLPETFLELWAVAVFKLNPKWRKHDVVPLRAPDESRSSLTNA